MIDLVRTRQGLDPQSEACCRLLAAVIVAAIKDACLPLKRQELERGLSLRKTSNDAVRFLLESGGPFELYSTLIGIEPDSIRRAFRRAEPDEIMKTPLIKSRDLRRLNWRAAHLPSEDETALEWGDFQKEQKT